MPPSTHLSTVLTPFQSLFSAPTLRQAQGRLWRKVQRLLIGTLLARGRRTITAALRHTGQGDTPSFSLYHHVLNRARWSALKGSCRLLALLVQTFGAARSSLTFVIDETLERRWGPRLKKRGHYRDSLASSRKRTVTSSGLRWVVLALVITPPWNRRCWALPILSVPAPAPGVSERLGLRHKTIAQWARQLIRVVRRWLPHAAITVLGDQACSVVELAHACRRCWVRLIAPLRLDAVLHEAPPQRQPGTRGRPRLKGKRLPSLAERLKDAATLWETLSVFWHDGRVQEVQMCSGTALWYRSGQPPLPIRWVLVRRHDQPPRALFSTCPDDRAADIVSAYSERWSIETTPDQVRGRLFEESRAHLGFETQRQWSDLATERSTPCLLSVVEGWACIRSWRCWRTAYTGRAACQYAGLPGTTSSRRRSATPWQRFATICGRLSIFQHPRLTPSAWKFPACRCSACCKRSVTRTDPSHFVQSRDHKRPLKPKVVDYVKHHEYTGRWVGSRV